MHCASGMANSKVTQTQPFCGTTNERLSNGRWLELNKIQTFALMELNSLTRYL